MYSTVSGHVYTRNENKLSSSCYHLQKHLFNLDTKRSKFIALLQQTQNAVHVHHADHYA